MRRAILPIVAMALIFGACGGDDATEADPDRPTDLADLTDEVQGETTVQAATPTAIPAVIEPERLSYAVQDGDLLGAIAQTFNVPMGALAFVNNIDNPDLLQIGQELVIPTEEDVADWEAASATAETPAAESPSTETGEADPAAPAGE